MPRSVGQRGKMTTSQASTERTSQSWPMSFEKPQPQPPEKFLQEGRVAHRFEAEFPGRRHDLIGRTPNDVGIGQRGSADQPPHHRGRHPSIQSVRKQTGPCRLARFAGQTSNVPVGRSSSIPTASASRARSKCFGLARHEKVEDDPGPATKINRTDCISAPTIDCSAPCGHETEHNSRGKTNHHHQNAKTIAGAHVPLHQLMTAFESRLAARPSSTTTWLTKAYQKQEMKKGTPAISAPPSARAKAESCQSSDRKTVRARRNASPH